MIIFDPKYKSDDWSALINGTLVWVDDPADMKPIVAGMEKYRHLQSAAEIDWDIESFTWEQLATLRSRSAAIRGDISYDDTSEGRLTLPIIALFMLLLACFNYVNIAIVSAARRLKEIGIRKVVGATRRKVVFQFLLENIFVTAIALVLGIALAATLFLPWFMDISDFPLSFEFFDINIWAFIGSLLFLTALLSGIYPALYISNFAVVKIFKGTLRFGKKNPLTKVFLSAQIVLACVCVVFGVIFVQNINYQNSRSWGYSPDGLLFAELPSKSHAYEKLEAVLRQNPAVIDIVGSTHHLGRSSDTKVIRMPDRSYSVNHFAVDAEYFETLELEMISGRTFDAGLETDASKIVVNELMVENLGLGDNPLGQRIKFDEATFEIVGVVNNFHSNNFYYEVLPTLFTMAKEGTFRYLTMRVTAGSEDQVFSELTDQWSNLFPESPFLGGHQTDVWGTFWEEVGTMGRFARTIAFIAVLLASMGLYGLVRINVLGRLKEFSIKKVLGANVQDFVGSIFKQYILLTSIALIIGLPLGYLCTKFLLELLYAYPMPIGYSGLVLATIILVFSPICCGIFSSKKGGGS